MNTTSGTALVLGGGGSTGNAWLIGVVAGLLDGGLDVTRADVIIGTSAGATAAAQVASDSPTRLLSDILSAPMPQQPARSPAPSGSAASHIARIIAITEAATDAADLRRRMGAAALEMETAAGDDAWREQWRATVATRLPSPEWPAQNVLITAVDASTGEPRVFDRTSGVDLVDAIAASCSSGRPYRIDGRPYIDGGYRANAENADLAMGRARVLVLSPFGGRSLVETRWRTDLASQVDDLRAGGSGVHVIAPTSDTEHLFGANAMDFTLRPAAGRAGYEQGRARAEELSRFWVSVD